VPPGGWIPSGTDRVGPTDGTDVVFVESLRARDGGVSGGD
jgi:hypothetical protein